MSNKYMWLIGTAALENLLQDRVASSIKSNSEFHYQVGMTPKIVRTSSGHCCSWCDEVAGTYEYPNVPKDVYRRHKRCDCTVEYDPWQGKRQNVWSKRWTDIEKSDKLNERIQFSNVTKALIKPVQLEFAVMIENNPETLAAFSPITLKRELENRGFEVLPLGRGKLKGKPFEEGGGYKVNYRGDGILQYHPAKGSRHGGRYYKIGNSKGKKWFNTKGEEIDVDTTGKNGRQIIKKI